MKIHVICTVSRCGRYVHTATTSPARLEDEFTRLVAGLSADGWHNVRTQFPNEPAEGAGRPRVVAVEQLRHDGRKDGDDWLNVEVYDVDE